MPVLGITGSIATGKSTFAQRLKERLDAELFDADAVARELLESDPAVQEEVLSVFGPDVAGPDGTIHRARLRSMIFGPKGSPVDLRREAPGRTALSGRAATGAIRATEATGPGVEGTGKTAGARSQQGECSQAETGATGTNDDETTLSPTPRERLEAILHPRIRARWMELASTFRAIPPGRQRWLLVDIPLLFETGTEGAFDVITVVACGEETQQRRLRERGLSPEVGQAIIASQLDLPTKMKRASHIIWSESSLTFLDEQAAVLAAHLQQRYG
ncbi:MAG TPA: dephospho-CoA kinase [Chthoniobacteraceae bacterium]|nr:dephospho-CoA kinase [Chthoniobacteraceae bacterium]